MASRLIRRGAVALLGLQLVCCAQDLTVHVVTDSPSHKPLSGIRVQLFPQPAMSGRRKVISQKSDSNGVVVFHNIDLTSIAWSVSIYNFLSETTDQVVILCWPENASSQGLSKHVGSTITSLPAEVTLHVRTRGFGEEIKYLFVGQ
jgi:hypothetical protein